MTTATSSLFARAGGEPVVRAIIGEFVAALVTDPMIGFFFADVDRERLQEREYQFTAGFLGADVAYSGRPLRAAHARHHIMGGQFDRRTRLLVNVLRRHEIAPDIEEAWLAHIESLRPQITQQASGDCD